MHIVSRRAVLGAGVTAVGLAITGVPATAAAAATPVVAPRRSLYSRLVGRQFLAIGETERRRLTLVAVRNVQGAARAERDTCFNLIFEPLDGQPLADGIYRVRRSGAHTCELFLSGVGGGTTIQALVNRVPAR